MEDIKGFPHPSYKVGCFNHFGISCMNNLRLPELSSELLLGLLTRFGLPGIWESLRRDECRLGSW